jgi:hypothetical protein
MEIKVFGSTKEAEISIQKFFKAIHSKPPKKIQEEPLDTQDKTKENDGEI